MDFYLDRTNQLNRLIEEYNKYGKIIIAYDFDDTVHDYHRKYRNYDNVINLLKSFRSYAHFICLTASGEHRYDDIKRYLDYNEIPYDALNSGIDLPGIPYNVTKPYYNILLDDRSGLDSTYKTLTELYRYIEHCKLEKRAENILGLVTERYYGLDGKYICGLDMFLAVKPCIKLQFHYKTNVRNYVVRTEELDKTSDEVLAEYICRIYLRDLDMEEIKGFETSEELFREYVEYINSLNTLNTIGFLDCLTIKKGCE